MKLLFSVRFLLFPLLLLALLSIVAPAQAQTITINQPLDFGRFVLADNTAPRVITLLSGGGFSADAEYIFFIDPEMGNVTVDGYPPATPLTVSVGTTSVDPVGFGSANFATSSTFTDPATIITDGTGSVTFDVGAVLTSDGGGVTHTDVTYNGTFSITVTP